MPARAPSFGQSATEPLAAIGARVRAHRKTLRLSATSVAESAGISRVTLHRIERGEPSVTIGAYMSAFVALGLTLDLVDVPGTPGEQRARRGLPKRIRVADYPQLRKIAWQLDGVVALTPREALALYERNWRHVDRAALGEDEIALIRRLVDGLGGERVLV